MFANTPSLAPGTGSMWYFLFPNMLAFFLADCYPGDEYLRQFRPQLVLRGPAAVWRDFSRPGWGLIVGNWGGYGVSDLEGSITDGQGYAFAMNTFELVAALAPLPRYDARYARAIGKLILNTANAARLFYANGLPPEGLEENASRATANGVRLVRQSRILDPTDHDFCRF